MSEETKRPRGGEGAPFGMRARNRTMVMDSGRIDSLRSQFQVPASVSPPTSADEPEVDASALDVFGRDETTAAPAYQGEDLVAFEDVLDTAEPAQKGDADRQPFDPFAFDDNSSARVDEPIAEDPFDEGGSEVPDAVPSISEPSGQTSQSAPKFIRSVPSMTTPPKAPYSQPQQEVFDPFAADSSPEVVEESPQGGFGMEDDLDSVFGDLPAMEEMPVVTAAQAGAPKIVRPGESGAANERNIVPPPAISNQPINIPPMTPATASNETSQTHKEAEDMTEPRDRIFWKAESPLVGFLVTYDHDPKGSYVELRQGRLMVSNQREASGSCLVVLGESISPMHAIMRVAPGGVVQVLDQLSEAGTRVKHMGQTEEEFLSGEKSTVSHGDTIFFGDRKFHVLLVIGEEETES